MTESPNEFALSAKSDPLPTSARAIVVGGGIVGASVAYHLGELGWRDVVLLEQNRLSGGTTWHAAGLVGRLRTSSSTTRINQYSAELYAQLTEETGIDVGWTRCGSLIVARTEERMTQLRRTAAMAELFDVEATLVDVDGIAALWPLMRTEDLLGGVFLPGDGKVKPDQTALALAKGAQMRGVAVYEDARVTGLVHSGGRVHGVETETETMTADVVVLAGGMWTRGLALSAGVTVPLYPVEHHYVQSAPIDGVHHGLPVCRDPDAAIYFRSEEDCVLLGAFQKYTKPWTVDAIPDDFSFKLLEDDWPKFADPFAAGKWRVPALEAAEFPKFVNGPESFTPDNQFILGETPELEALYIAAGFNSAGIACAGGAGKVLAEWIADGAPGMDLWSVDPRRFAPIHNEVEFLRERVTETLGLHYQMAWPNREFETGRDLRRTPIHDRLVKAGASFGTKMGWERPNWFAGEGAAPTVEYSFGRQNWFDAFCAEQFAARNGVALFDQSSFSKYIVRGADAARVLEHICGNRIDVAPGKIVYTGLFNKRGTFESDLTVIRLAADEFLVVTATSQTQHDAHWIRRNSPDGADVALTDVTTDFGVLGLMGPKSRDVLERVTPADVSNPAFPFATAQTIRIADVETRALRVTYVGELGWELHVPMPSLAAVFDELVDAGQEFGLRLAGHYAINALRLEKAYRAWGHELSPDDTPLEAGLSFAVAWSKPFLGRERLLEQKSAGVRKRLVTFVLDNSAVQLWGSEPILRDGIPVGYTTSGAFGATVGAAVAMGYVRADAPVDAAFIRAGRYEIVVDGERISAQAHLRAPYDPKRERILC